jgi:hypothetical protein
MFRLAKNFESAALLFSFFTCLSFLPSKSSAQGDLLIYPKRLVFDGSKRLEEINLSNNGMDTARYAISVIELRMKDDGSFEMVDQPEPGQHFADKNFRFFPRTVVLGPKETQVVKVQLYRTAELEPGEYRSHIYLRAEKEEKPRGEEKAPKEPSSISIRLEPVFGISIPIIIRVGESTTELNLSKVRFQLQNDTIPTLTMDINRTGNMSAYGNILVEYVPLNSKKTGPTSILNYNTSGKAIPVASIKGIAIYTPNAVRHVRILLAKKPEIDYHKGALRIVYKDQSGKAIKLAQEQIFLQ